VKKANETMKYLQIAHDAPLLTQESSGDLLRGMKDSLRS